MERPEFITDEKALDKFAGDTVAELKFAIAKATGKSAESLEYYLTKGNSNGFRIIADPHVVTLIIGRKPTGAGFFKNDNKTLQQLIYDWILVKGITSTDLTQMQLSWAISESIHKKGTLLWQAEGAGNFVDRVWTNEKVNAFMSTYSGTLAERTLEYLTQNFN